MPAPFAVPDAQRRALLEWYRPRRREYPWRVRPTPYRVLVSEVMLQQTQARRVVEPFRAFLGSFPTVTSLARASRAEVVRAWAGLGYNRRAVSLSQAARAIVREHGGRVPHDVAELRALPGVGPYTAGAIASLGYGLPAPVVDTNVRRIIARVALGTEPHELPARRIEEIAGAWLDRSSPGDWNQALMDLGREICRPAPRCASCPLAGACRFCRGRIATRRPRRQSAFEGSTRQVRGRVVDAARERGSASLATIARRAGEPLERVASAVRTLAADGLVAAGPAALDGRPTGRVRLAD